MSSNEKTAVYLRNRKKKRFSDRRALLNSEFESNCPNIKFDDIEKVYVNELYELQKLIKKIISLNQKKEELNAQGIQL